MPCSVIAAVREAERAAVSAARFVLLSSSPMAVRRAEVVLR